jgi:prevent-host-death family protein
MMLGTLKPLPDVRQCTTLVSVTTIPVRELNQDTAGVLARVERGETLEITRHHRVIARIVPVLHAELDDLVAAGRMIPPTVTSAWQAPEGSVPPGPQAGELVRQLRDEERY